MSMTLPDPRGVLEARPSALAPRLARLSSSRMLLIDNGKLAPAYGPHRFIAAALPELFGEAEWSTFRRDFLTCEHDRIPALAEEIAALSPDAAVLALADAGVSVQTMLTAMELERCGIPCVVLATGAGSNACRSIARTRMPGFPIVILDIARSDSDARVRAGLTAIREALESALTRQPDIPETAPPGTGLVFSPPSGDLSDLAAFQDWLHDNALGDGLPLLPPLPDAVAALLAAVPLDPDEAIYSNALTSGRTLRVRDAAVNAAMTGCPPAAFPVVLAALKAAAQPEFRLLQAAITTHPSGYCVLLSGTDPARFGLSGGPGCLGPGHRGNLAVGRAVSLTIQHLFEARPGQGDLTVFGSPAEISYCMGEDMGPSPWSSLAQERGFDGPSVLLSKAEAPRNVVEHLDVSPRALCTAIARGACSHVANNAFVPGDLIVFLNPEHAAIFGDAGWSRTDVARAIHARATLPRNELDGRGLAPIRPPFMDALDALPVTRSPEDVHIVLGGAVGPHSMVAMPWGFSRAQWMPVPGT